MMLPQPLLTIEDLTIRIGGHDRLHCDRLEIRSGDRVVLTSASGKGKSLLLRCLAGQLPIEWVTSGWFRRGSDAASNYARYCRARAAFQRTSFIVQDAMNALHPMRPVSRQLRDGLSGLSGDDPARATQVQQDLTMFHLATLDILNQRLFANRLSGGQCQRIALLFATDPARELVLLDEPLTDIDAQARASIQGLLAERILAPTPARTVILVTHDIGWLRALDPDHLRHVEIGDGDVRNTARTTAERRGTLVERFGNDKLRVVPWPVADATAGSPTAFAADDDAGQAALSAPILRLRLDAPVVLADGRLTPFQLHPFPKTHDLADGLTIRRGEGVAIHGRSGSGKSLLLRSMAGLWPWAQRHRFVRTAQTDAACAPQGADITMCDPADLAPNIQYVFQNNRGSVALSDTLDRDLTALRRRSAENIFQSLGRHGDARQRADLSATRVEAAIEAMVRDLWVTLKIPMGALADRKKIKLAGFSLGMLRRYTLIRALVKLDLVTAWQPLDGSTSPFRGCPWQIRAKPRLLLADEISRGLDDDSLAELARLISSLKSSAGLAVVLVSHEAKFTRALAERVYRIEEGRLSGEAVRIDDLLALQSVGEQVGLLS